MMIGTGSFQQQAAQQGMIRVAQCHQAVICRQVKGWLQQGLTRNAQDGGNDDAAAHIQSPFKEACRVVAV